LDGLRREEGGGLEKNKLRIVGSTTTCPGNGRREQQDLGREKSNTTKRNVSPGGHPGMR
jgi:hypothetical protein